MRSPRKWLQVGGCLPLLAVSATLAAAPPAAQASAEHPKIVGACSGEAPCGRKTDVIDWGQILFRNRALGALECVNLAFGTVFPNTEPGAAGRGTESYRAYGEVLGWSGASYTNSSGREPGPRCKSSTGFVAWATPEPAPSVSTVTAKENTTGSERLFLHGPLGVATHREPPSLPWLEEAEGTENTETRVKTFYVKTGIAANTEERLAVEEEEAGAGIPTELRTGCYHQPPFTEILREPGYTSARETELTLRTAPAGCIKVNIIAPEVGVEVPFQGTLEPEEVNGARNGLQPSTGVFGAGIKVICEIVCIDTEGSERNERALLGTFGPGYTSSPTPIKEIGYLNEALLTLK